MGRRRSHCLLGVEGDQSPLCRLLQPVDNQPAEIRGRYQREDDSRE